MSKLMRNVAAFAFAFALVGGDIARSYASISFTWKGW